jgi:hypothetical protein
MTALTTTSLRALLLLGALPLAAAAQRDGDRVDTTVVLDRGGIVQLGAVSGEIRVVGADRRDVRIIAEIERGRFETSFTSGRVGIATRSVGGRQSSARYDVIVPTGTRVIASTVSGRIEISATGGEVSARSTSGSVEVRGARERVEATSVSGDIDVRDVTGRIRVEAVSADLEVEQARGELSAETVSGTISIRRSELESLQASAVSGSISYEGTLVRTGSYRMNTHSGSVMLAVPASSGAMLELETFSGRISSDFPLTMQPGETGRRGRRMEFTIGEGGARVTIGAFSGNITIRRGGAAVDRE